MHGRRWLVRRAALGASLFFLLGYMAVGEGTTYTVTNTNDSGTGSLRQAILDANADPGSTIAFDIPDTDPGYDSGTGTWLIQPVGDLPKVTGSGTVIDGSTQTANQGDRNPVGPEVVLSGWGGTNGNGLWFAGCENGLVRGLVIHGFSAGWGGWGWQVAFEGGSGHVVEGCYLGTDATGMVAVGAAPGDDGVSGGVFVSGSNCRVGGTSVSQRNVMSGKGCRGVYVGGAGATGNVIQGNYIGVDRTGNGSLGHVGSSGYVVGILVRYGATNTLVGGSVAGAGNVISGNEEDGILLQGDEANPVSGTVIEGNKIGTNAAGDAAVPNGGDGIDFRENGTGGTGNRVGGAGAGAGNVISGNAGSGVSFYQFQGTVVEGNYIGVDVTGRAKLGNGGHGVVVGAPGVVVGGSAGGSGNVIGGNGGDGVRVSVNGSVAPVVQGNWIGTDAGETVDLGNVGNGVYVLGYSPLVVGGLGVGEGNAIANNGGHGFQGGGYLWSSVLTVRGNRMWANGKLGIDLLAPGDPPSGVTLNDEGDADSMGGNPLCNYPILLEASVLGSELALRGFARPGSTIDLYLAQRDPTGFGEGKRYLLTVNEGSTADRDSGLGTYSGQINGLNQGTDTTNRFEFVVPRPSGVVANVQLTATATIANNTSEFGGCVKVAGPTLAYLSQPANAAAGEPLGNVQVEVRNNQGQRMTNATNSVTVTARRGGQSVTLQGTTTVSAQAGVASFNDLSLTAAGTGYTLVATAEGMPETVSASFDIRAGPADAQRSLLSADRTTATANGRDAVNLTITARDRFDNPIPGLSNVTVSAENTVRDVPGVTITQPSQPTDAQGQTTARVDSTNATTATLRAKIGETVVSQTVEVRFQPWEVSTSRSTLVADKTGAQANGVDPVSLTVTALDAHGNPIPNLPVTLSADPPAGVTLTQPSAATDATGRATGGATSTKSGTVTFSASVDGRRLDQTVPVAFGAGAADANRSTLDADKASAIANGSEQVTLTVTLLDAHGNPVPGVTVSVAAEPGESVSVNQPSTATDAVGVARATATASRPGEVVFAASAGGTLLATTVTVSFTPRVVDPARSEVRLAPARIAADGTERAVLEVTLRDAGGVAVEGSPVGVRSLTATTDGAVSEAVTVVSAGLETSEDGVFELAVTANAAGVYLLVVQIGEVALRAVTLTAREYYALRLPAGLHLAGVPLAPDEDSVAELLGRPGVEVVCWEAAAGRYVRAGGGRPAFGSYEGWWVRSVGPVSVTLRGEGLTPGVARVPLERGWNIITNPYDSDIGWDLRHIRVLMNGQPAGTLATEELWSSVVQPYGWCYDPGRHRYKLVFDASRPGFAGVENTVERQCGLWVRATAAGVSLEFEPSVRYEGRATREVQRARRAAKEVTARDWNVLLRACGEGGGGGEVLFGVASQLGRGLEVETPPPAETSAGVELVLRGRDGRPLSGEMRRWSVGAQEWALTATSTTGEAVTISWPGLLRQLPAGLMVELTDRQTDRTVLLNTHTSYVYAPSRAGEAREFVVTARFGHLARSSITSLTAQGTRGRGVSVALTLTGPAEVHVVVRGLRGGVMKELSARADSAGPLALSWDGTDAAGRRVPAGTYLIEATAQSPNGALARTVRTVQLR